MCIKGQPRIENNSQFDSMPKRGKTDAVFILRRMQEEYHTNEKKLYMCFADPEKSLDRVPRKVLEWTMRMKGIPEHMVRSVVKLYERAKTRVKVCSEW